MTTGHTTPEELEARIAELATGFALGDLQEEELRELYALLRDDSGVGATAARITWQTMGIVTDLRAQVAHSFQDTLRLRIGQDRNGRFRNRLWKRLGFGVPFLAPIEVPPPRRSFSILTWTVLGVVTATLVSAAILLAALREHPAHATVTHLIGDASSAGRALIPDSDLDGQPFAVKPGSQLTLRWPDGSIAIVSGDVRGDDGAPAEAAVSARGLVLQYGRAWITAHSGFTLTLPDHAATVLSDESTIALEVVDGQSFLGVRHGALHIDGVSDALGDNGGFGPAGGFSWRWEWDDAAGTVSPEHPAPADWRLTAEASWSDPNDAARLSLSAADHVVLTLVSTPGLLTILVDGREIQHVTLPGSPLLGYRLALQQKSRRTLAITIADQSASITLPQAVDHYSVSRSPGATFKLTAFYPLPDPRPPLAANGWSQ